MNRPPMVQRGPTLHKKRRPALSCSFSFLDYAKFMIRVALSAALRVLISHSEICNPHLPRSPLGRR